MAIDTSTMDQIISNVFDEMLTMPTESLDPTPDTFDQERVVASIRISGAADELIVVEAPVSTAKLIGETMFAADPGTLEEEEVLDAVGEIVNMIGGNVKGTYEGESQLSLPCVSETTGPCDVPQEVGERAYVQVSGSPVLVRWQDV